MIDLIGTWSRQPTAEIRAAIAAGLTAFRVICKGESPAELRKRVEDLLAVCRSDSRFSVYLDLPGTRPRTAHELEPLHVAIGETVRFSTSASASSIRTHNLKDHLPCVRIDDIVSVGDGCAVFRVATVETSSFTGIATQPGTVLPNRSIAFSASEMAYTAMSDLDTLYMEELLELPVDGVIVSMASSAADIARVRAAVRTSHSVIAKIETDLGIRNFESIAAAADSTMLGRGDLRALGTAFVARAEHRAVQWLRGADHGRLIVATGLLASVEAGAPPAIAEISEVALFLSLGVTRFMVSTDNLARIAETVREIAGAIATGNRGTGT